MSNNFLKSTSIILITLVVLFDGISALIVALLYFFFTGNTDYTVLEATVGVVMRQQAQLVLLVGIGYLLLCVASLIYWSLGKRSWDTFLTVLGLTYVIGLALLTIMSEEFFQNAVLTPLLSFSLAINLIMIVLVHREKAKIAWLPSNTG